MANLSSKTRKGQVLRRLLDQMGGWVDGPELANERVGGSEGLRRLRELQEEGRESGNFRIDRRRHPNPQRDIWQYRLVMTPAVTALRETIKRQADGNYEYVAPTTTTRLEVPDEPAESHHFARPPERLSLGSMVICPRCKGRGNDPGNKSKVCIRCKGHFVVPNVGPIAPTRP